MTYIKFKYIFAALFFVGYFTLFVYIDIINGCFIRITPTFLMSNILKVKKSLLLIKTTTTDEYSLVCQNVNNINLNSFFCGKLASGCYPGETNINKKKIYLRNSYRYFQIKTLDEQFAKTIIHETCHVLQHKENRPYSESECGLAGENLMVKINKYKGSN